MKTLSILTAVLACTLAAQTAEVKPAEQVYKNIIEMKGTPADQLGAAMQFISASLGVECGTCHVQGKFEADDKPAKKTARAMMAMTAAINKNAFNGRQQVTCFSCHRGAAHPVAVPSVLDSDAAPVKVPEPPAATVTADQIIEKYVTALGGADAIKKVSSRIQKGEITAGGTKTPIEVFTKSPNKRITVTHGGSGDSFTAFDGTIGWMGNAGRPAREMSPADARGSALDSEFSLALRLKEIFPQFRVGRPEKIGDIDAVTLTATRPNLPPVRMSFDAKSGLLLRMVRYTENPMGRMPVQIDYADYREVEGVKIPYRWTLSRPNGRFTIQINEVKQNVPIEDTKFAKPEEKK
jgi:photosynthetic reaction center cytochrome c subunit